MVPLPTFDFCEHLFAQGVLIAQPWKSADPDEQPAVHSLIQRVEHLARLDAPLIAPTFDIEAAQWALGVLSWSVNLLVDRANASTSLPPELASTEPSGQTACHHWSVDLALRYLAEVLLRARAAAADDALVVELVSICNRWPLACVGTQTEWNAQRGSIILENECLRHVLLDRIVARSDKKLAEVPAIRGYIESIAQPTQRSIDS